MRSDAIDPWRLVMSGRYAEAVEAYAAAYESDGRPFHLHNQGIAELLAGDYGAAWEAFRRANEARLAGQRSDSEYVLQGVCAWYLARPTETIVLWRGALNAPYTDAAGGVQVPALLLYAGQRLGDAHLVNEAVTLLRRHARRRLRAWPGPIVPLLLGKMDADTVDLHVRAGGALAHRWRCQADFYVGLRSLREGDMDTFRKRIQSAAENRDAILEVEHHLARWEVEHGFQELGHETEHGSGGPTDLR